MHIPACSCFKHQYCQCFAGTESQYRASMASLVASSLVWSIKSFTWMERFQNCLIQMFTIMSTSIMVSGSKVKVSAQKKLLVIGAKILYLGQVWRLFQVHLGYSPWIAQYFLISLVVSLGHMVYPKPFGGHTSRTFGHP